jgi:universal stress protein A
MFKKLLVPVDLTGKTLRAVRAAVRAAAPTRAQTVLLHVIERVDAGAPERFRSFYGQLERNAREKMRPLAAEFEKKGLPVRAEIRYGDRVREILRFAEESRTELIVMSSHRLRRGSKDWGTISYKVGILARCPVLLVK